MVSKKASNSAAAEPGFSAGLNVIELLAKETNSLLIAEIATALGVSVPACAALIKLLETRGYVEQIGQDKRYRLSNSLFELGMRHAPVRNLHDAALPVMHRLAIRTQQSCHLSVPSGDDVVVVARVESPAAVGFAVQVGFRLPMLISTSARLIYMTLPAATKKEWIARMQANGATSDLIASFMKEAKLMAARGHAIQPSKIADGISDLGAPIFNGENLGAVACLMMPYLSHRFLKTATAEAVLLLREASAEISKRLQQGVEI